MKRVGLVAAVAVVEADVRVVLDRALVDRHVQRRLVLDRRLAQVAVADRLAGALEAAAGLGHGLIAGVPELVLVEVVGPCLRAELAHDRPRLLHVIGEGHDGQEVRLRLGDDAPDLRVVEVVAAQPVVHRVARAPALADRLDHGRRAGPHVARGEDLGQSVRKMCSSAPAFPRRLTTRASSGSRPAPTRSMTDPVPGRWRRARCRTRR